MVGRFQNSLTGYFKVLEELKDNEESLAQGFLGVGLTSHDQSVHPFVHPSMAPFVDGANAKELVLSPSVVCITVVKLVK